MERKSVVQSIKNALSTLTFPYEAKLYGSEARGDARADSDIDILVLVDKTKLATEDENAVFAALYPIELATGILINPLVMLKSEWGKRVSPFFVNVENDAVAL